MTTLGMKKKGVWYFWVSALFLFYFLVLGLVNKSKAPFEVFYCHKQES